ncbi:MAG: hypothetical protein ACTS6G_05655, partial [Candidatus Hodgkinia cicadicola]
TFATESVKHPATGLQSSNESTFVQSMGSNCRNAVADSVAGICFSKFITIFTVLKNLSILNDTMRNCD